MPLADRRSRPAGFLLLRRQDRRRHAVLRLSRPRRLSAAGSPARPQAGTGLSTSQGVTNSGGAKAPPVLFARLANSEWPVAKRNSIRHSLLAIRRCYAV